MFCIFYRNFLKISCISLRNSFEISCILWGNSSRKFSMFWENSSGIFVFFEETFYICSIFFEKMLLTCQLYSPRELKDILLMKLIWNFLYFLSLECFVFLKQLFPYYVVNFLREISFRNCQKYFVFFEETFYWYVYYFLKKLFWHVLIFFRKIFKIFWFFGENRRKLLTFIVCRKAYRAGETLVFC